MAEISAADVMKLRKMSGQGMMDCKNALNEAEGDTDKAMGILRKKGLATLEKRAGRQTSEGMVVSKVTDDSKTTILASLCCETDFVVKSDDFIMAADKLAEYAIACSADSGAQALMETELDGRKYSEVLTETVSKTGEKTEIGDYARYNLDGAGMVSIYIHFNKKVGTMVEVAASDETVAASDEVKEAANGIAMHITAVKPLALDESGIDPKTIEQEKVVFKEQVKGKPENIIEKIIEGKLNKFYAENCLLAQPYVKDDSKTVAQVISDAGKAAGGQASIKRFVRLDVSE